MFKKIKEKFLENIKEQAIAWFKDLDLDEDGQKDVEEQIIPWIEKAGAGFNLLFESVDAKKAARGTQIVSRMVADGKELFSLLGDSVDKEKADGGILILREVAKDSYAYVIDAATKDETELK